MRLMRRLRSARASLSSSASSSRPAAATGAAKISRDSHSGSARESSASGVARRDTRVARTAAVQRVSLVLCCVPDPNADREGRLLPAWLVQYAYGRDDTAAERDNLHLVAFSQITGEKLGESALPPSFDRRNAEER